MTKIVLDKLDKEREEIVKAALRRAAMVAQEKHDAAVKWAETYLKSFEGSTDSRLIAEEIRSLAQNPDEIANILKGVNERTGRPHRKVETFGDLTDEEREEFVEALYKETEDEN